MDNLKKSTLNGFFWTTGQQFGVHIINFAAHLILARLLDPSVFGVIAMLSIFMTIGQTLMDGGMASSLIRTNNADEKDYSTVFFINLISSIFIYLILFLLAPYISKLFGQPILTEILRIYTLTFIIQAFTTVQVTRLTKEMNFKQQLKIQIPSTILGATVGLILALQDFGVWSLVFLALTTSFVSSVLYWIKSDWRPKHFIDKEKLKIHFGFGSKLVVSGLITNIYSNIYIFIIGKFFSAQQLGFYSQANNLRMFPVRNITIALQKVTYPLFSKIQDDNVRLKKIFKKITKLVFFIVSPIMIFLILAAKPIFQLVLTEKWNTSIPFFQILCIGAIFYPQSIYNLNIISAKGKSDLHLKLELIKKISSSLFLFLIFPFGIWGIVYAQTISMLIHAGVNTYYSGKLINYSLKEQFFDVLPILIYSLISYFVSLFLVVNFFNTSNNFLLILANAFFFFLTYLLLCILFKVDSFKDVKSIISDFKKLKV